MEPYPRSYTEPLGRFSQIPKELQIEAFIRLPWGDIANICLSGDPPSICLSKEFWEKLIRNRKPQHHASIISKLFSPVVNDILKDESIPGPQKHYIFSEPGTYRSETIVVKASDPMEVLVKLNEDFLLRTDLSLYEYPIDNYIDNLESEFSFKDLIEYILDTFLVGHRQGEEWLVEVRMLE